jgi:hypothetical protein
MKYFFFKTYYFWTITRVVFIAAGLIDLLTVFPRASNGLFLLIDIATLCYIGLMIYNTIIELQNKTRQLFTKYIVGIISILIAVSIFFLVMTYSSAYVVLAVLFVAWLALLGVFDLVVMNRQEEDSDIPD